MGPRPRGYTHRSRLWSAGAEIAESLRCGYFAGPEPFGPAFTFAVQGEQRLWKPEMPLSNGAST